jgi:hypothetical protein
VSIVHVARYLDLHSEARWVRESDVLRPRLGLDPRAGCVDGPTQTPRSRSWSGGGLGFSRAWRPAAAACSAEIGRVLQDRAVLAARRRAAAGDAQLGWKHS